MKHVYETRVRNTCMSICAHDEFLHIRIVARAAQLVQSLVAYAAVDMGVQLDLGQCPAELECLDGVSRARARGGQQRASSCCCSSGSHRGARGQLLSQCKAAPAVWELPTPAPSSQGDAALPGSGSASALQDRPEDRHGSRDRACDSSARPPA